MEAIKIAVDQRNKLRREADAHEREADRLALAGDKAYEDSADQTATAYQKREQVKQLQTLIDGLGGEPKERRKPLLKGKAKAAA